MQPTEITTEESESTPVVATETEAPKPDKPAEVKPGDEIRSALMENPRFWSRLKGDGRTLEKAKPEETKKAEGKPDEPEPESKADPAPKKQKAPASKGAKPAPERIAEITAREQGRAIGEAIADKLQPKQAVAKDPVPEPIPDEYVKDAQVYGVMEQMFPDKYAKGDKSLSVKFRDAIKTESDYMKKWLDEHPGEDFDGNSEEHNSFYKRTFPVINDDDFQSARDEMISRRAEENATRRVSAEIEALKTERRVERIKPEIQATMDRVRRNVLEAINPALKDAPPETLADLSETDPVAAEVSAAVDLAYKPVLQANIEIHRGVTQFQAGDQSHMMLFKVADALEQRVQALAPEDRFDDRTGKYFAPRSEWLKMDAVERNKHWFVGEAEIAYALESEIIKEARSGYKEYEKKLKFMAEKKGFTPPSEASVTQKQSKGKSALSQSKPHNDDAQTRSPSVPIRAPVGGGATRNSGSEQSGYDIFYSRLKGA